MDWQIRVSVTPNLDTYSREEVDGLFDLLVGAAPTALDTLEKIAASIGGVSNAVMLKGNNLSDLGDPTAARGNLGLGSVNNTSDATKPVSAPQAAAINAVVASVFPVGTAMVFYNATVPSTWIKQTTHSDKAMRVVSTSGGGSGGTLGFSTVFTKTAVDNHTLSYAEMPFHIHGINDPAHSHGTTYAYLTLTGGWVDMTYGQGVTANIGYSADINYAYSGVSVFGAGSNVAHNHGMDIRVQYVDVLIGVKA